MRQLAHAELEIHLTAHGDVMRVFDRARVTREQLVHLLLVLEIEFIGLELHPVGVIERAVGLHAEEDAVRLAVVLFDVVAVVGRDNADADLLGDAHQIGYDPPLLGDAVILQLHKEAVASEQVAVVFRLLLRALVVAREQSPRQLSRKAGGQADQALVILLQQLVVDARLGIKALGEAL